MTRRDWWLGILAVVLAVLLHALLPRYEIRSSGQRILGRIDHWTGTIEIIGPNVPAWYRVAAKPPLSIIKYEPLPAAQGQYRLDEIEPQQPKETGR